MIRANFISTKGAWQATPADTIVLDHEGRHRRRVAMTGTRGTEFLLDLPEAVALRGGDEMEACWRPRLDDIAVKLGPAADWPILPLHTCLPGIGEDDFGGTLALARALKPGAPLLLPELGDRQIWSRRISPARLKALVGRCALVVTNRELPAAYAVASGVSVLGLAVGMDRRILTCFATLANDLPRSSRMLVVPPPG